MELLKCLFVAYLIGINIFGFTLLRIQKKEIIFETESAPTKPQNQNKETDTTQNESNRSEFIASEASQSIENEIATDEVCRDTPLKPREDELSKEQIKQELKKDKSKRQVRDLTILIVSAIGGALAVYLGMFLMRYKLKNMLLMICNPVLIGLHIYLVVLLFQNYIAVV